MLILRRDRLFATCTEKSKPRYAIPWRLALCTTAFACHVAAGIYYYHHVLTGNRALNFFG